MPILFFGRHDIMENKTGHDAFEWAYDKFVIAAAVAREITQGSEWDPARKWIDQVGRARPNRGGR